MRRAPVQCFPGPAIHQVCNRIQLLLAVDRKIRALGQELANQAIGVLVGAPLPWAVGVTEIHHNPGIGAELLLVGHLLAPVIGQGLSHGLRRRVEFVRESLQDVSRRCGVGEVA